MKIKIISTFLGHGKILQEFGTGLSILLSLLPEVKQIEVITWEKDSTEAIELPEKISINPAFSISNPLSIFRTLEKCVTGKADLFIFNLMPTTYANSNLANLIGLLIPLFLKKVFKQNVAILYHNSLYTNDFEKLGYTGIFNKLRAFVIRPLEKLLFRSVNMFMLSKNYVEIIRKQIKGAKVSHIDLKFFQSVGTLCLNNLLNESTVTLKVNKTPRILLFGSWGPQKDPTPVLEALKKIRSAGIRFHLTMAGGINLHFFKSKTDTDQLSIKYSNIIDDKMEYVPEALLYSLFSKSDILVLNYATPGGFSSVLSMGIFFNLYIIASHFKEFVEQADNYSKIKFCDPVDLECEIQEYILKVHPKMEPRKIEIAPIVNQMVHSLRTATIESVKK